MTGFSIRVDRCVRCGYAWCRIGAAWLRACAAARALVSSVPVPDADTLDMEKRAYMRASCGGGHARYVQSGVGTGGLRRCFTVV